jgi:hypothetical protein
MTDGKKLCVLTVHGIGFQQPPTDSAAGYADVLHENLSDGLQAIGAAWARIHSGSRAVSAPST